MCKKLTCKITKYDIFKTVRKTLPLETNPTEHFQNSARGTYVPMLHRKHIQNSAQCTNVTTNLSEHIKKSAQGTNVPNNHTEHIQNSAQHSNVAT